MGSLQLITSKMSSFVLLLLALQVASSAAAKSTSPSSSSSLLVRATSASTSTRHAFYPRPRRRRDVGVGAGTSSSATATSTILSHRKTTSKIIQTAKKSSSSSRWSTSASATDFGSEFNDQNDSYFHPRYATTTIQREGEPTLEELRAQLSPLSLLISNAIELTVVTLGSYLSGGLLGYIGGSVMGIPSTLLGKDMGNFLSRLGALHTKAIVSCKSWATLSASFSGFNNLVRLCRGEEHNDNWNAVLGSAMTGAFLNRNGGVQAMVQGGATYAAFTYCLDKFFGTSPRQGSQQHSSELMYTDIDIDD
jgi:hypothetical protein